MVQLTSGTWNGSAIHGTYINYNASNLKVTGGALNTIQDIGISSIVYFGEVNASKFTFEHVKFLGLIQISLGLLAGIFINHGLLFWAIGFGVVHIAYGIIAYFTFEKN